jgi:hypothetical protein
LAAGRCDDVAAFHHVAEPLNLLEMEDRERRRTPRDNPCGRVCPCHDGATAFRSGAGHALDEGFAYRYSSLRAYPIVQFSHGGVDEIACPVPTLLFWRITTGLYYSLKEQPGFPTAFGESFQAYAGEVLQQRIVNPASASRDGIPRGTKPKGFRRLDRA